MKLILLLLLLFETSNVHAQRRQRRRGGPRRPPQALDASVATPAEQKEILLESNFREWENFLLYPEQGFINYQGIYFNPQNNRYFFAVMHEISNIGFSLTNATEEKVFSPDVRETSLIYVGNISPFKRIFANTNRNKLFVKILTPIQDNIHLDNSRIIRGPIPPVQPVLNNLFRVQYTNRAGNLFQRLLSRNGILQVLGDIPEYMLPKEPVAPPVQQNPNRRRRRRPQQRRQQ